MPNVLIIAYHFPPAADGSGHLRTLAFTRYLPRFGWQPVVLSAHPRAYVRTDGGSLAALSEELPVVRAFALDARRHLGIRGSYPLLLAQPDRWSSWWFGAVPAGLRLIRRYRPSVIWSTYPIATAHLIAYTLHRISGLPWVADFRDPVGVTDLGASDLTRRVRDWVEKKTVANTKCNIFTTAGAAALYAKRYQPRCQGDFVVIPNGYDDVDFVDFPIGLQNPVSKDRPVRLVHSGVLYRKQRDPTAFLAAIAELSASGGITSDSLQVVFRASGHEKHYERLIAEWELERIVSLQPAIPYREALQEQYEADGLLLFQGSEYNLQVPAKIYEYLRIGKPIFALTDPAGDTAAIVKATGAGPVVDMTSKEAIEPALRRFIQGLRYGTLPTPSPEQIAKYSRCSGAEELAALLDKAAAGKGPKT